MRKTPFEIIGESMELIANSIRDGTRFHPKVEDDHWPRDEFKDENPVDPS